MSIISAIETKLRAEFAPELLKVVDDSAAHAGHEGITGGESHVSIIIVSDKFAGLSRVDRQRAVYAVIDHEIKRIHALTTLRTLTKSEYAALPKPIA